MVNESGLSTCLLLCQGRHLSRPTLAAADWSHPPTKSDLLFLLWQHCIYSIDTDPAGRTAEETRSSFALRSFPRSHVKSLVGLVDVRICSCWTRRLFWLLELPLFLFVVRPSMICVRRKYFVAYDIGIIRWKRWSRASFVNRVGLRCILLVVKETQIGTMTFYNLS